MKPEYYMRVEESQCITSTIVYELDDPRAITHIKIVDHTNGNGSEVTIQSKKFSGGAMDFIRKYAKPTNRAQYLAIKDRASIIVTDLCK